MITLAAIRVLLPSTAKLIALGVAATAITGVVTWWSLHQYNKGWTAAINSMAAKDKEAVDAADNASARFRECRDAGRVWRTSTGDCQ
jgi:hypothetical protein